MRLYLINSSNPLARYRHFSEDAILREMATCNRRFYAVAPMFRRVLGSLLRRSQPSLTLFGNLSYRSNLRLDKQLTANFTRDQAAADVFVSPPHQNRAFSEVRA